MLTDEMKWKNDKTAPINNLVIVNVIINTDSYQFSFAIIENIFNEKEKYSQFPVHHFFA